MNRSLISLALAAFVALPLVAQQTAPAAAADGSKVVAVVNGETITRAQFDTLWNRMSDRMRRQYEKNGGGKAGFLDNYIKKRLLLQKARQSGFDKSPEVQAELEAAKEAALFDVYVRDVLAAPVVNETAIRKFYDENPSNFAQPERAKVRLIQVSTAKRSKEAAREIITNIMTELFPVKTTPEKLDEAFAVAASKHSDHPSAAAGGDLGWIGRDAIDPKLSEAAFTMKRGAMSGILETDDALYLLLLEAREPASVESYESAKAGIREYLMGVNTQKVVENMNKTATELAATAKVTVNPENLQ